MPFPGITAGSQLEKKIDRCMESVKRRQPGLTKSQTIAICRASITQKTRQDAIKRANYRSSGPASTKTCGTCSFLKNGRCSLFKFSPELSYTCNRWRPNIPALRKRGQQLRQKSIIKKLKNSILATLKRSRGPAEQRAMFAKMGASGSLQAKGPDGKRTGEKIPPPQKLDKEGLPLEPRARAAAIEKRWAEERKILDARLKKITNKWVEEEAQLFKPETRDTFLPPKGERAPRGKGREWAARRWIANRIDVLIRRREEGSIFRQNYRGQRRTARENTRRKWQGELIDESIGAARVLIDGMVQNNYDFADALPMFKDILSLSTIRDL